MVFKLPSWEAVSSFLAERCLLRGNYKAEAERNCLEGQGGCLEGQGGCQLPGPLPSSLTSVSSTSPLKKR